MQDFAFRQHQKGHIKNLEESVKRKAPELAEAQERLQAARMYHQFRTGAGARREEVAENEPDLREWGKSLRLSTGAEDGPSNVD